MKQLKEIVAIDPDYECPEEESSQFKRSELSRVDAWLEVFVIYFLTKDHINTSNKLLGNNPDNAYAHYLRGSYYLCKNYRLENAEEELLKAISLNPSYLDARWYLAVVYYSQGKDPELIKAQLKAIIEEKPDYECTDEAFPKIRYRSIKTLRADTWLKSLNGLSD